MIGGIGETDKKKSLSEIAIDVLGKNEGILSDTSIRSKISNLEM